MAVTGWDLTVVSIVTELTILGFLWYTDRRRAFYMVLAMNIVSVLLAWFVWAFYS